MLVRHIHNLKSKIKRMSFLTTIGRTLRKFDLFPNTKFLRYNGQDQYNTTTGGIISAAVIIIFAVLFTSMGFRTVTKQIITSSVSVLKELEPEQVTFRTSSGGELMFGISFFRLDWETANQLFNVTLVEEQYAAGYNLLGETVTQMVQCTPWHYSYSDMSSLFTSLNLGNAFCPPLNHIFKVKGKASSDSFIQFRIVISRCNWTIDSNCINDTEFAFYEQTYGSFIVDVPLVQTSINADNYKSKSLYYEDQNYFTFNSQLGIEGTFLIQQDKIETDVSILPFTQTQTEYITRIPDIFTKDYYIQSGEFSGLANLIFKKSSKTVTYTRSFNKLDAFFSYVGGLIGTIFTLVFIVGKYTEVAYEVSLSKKVFLSNDRKELSSGTFNFFTYIKFTLKKALNLLGCTPDWPKMQLFQDSCDQLGKQLDITYLLRKLMFVDAIADKLFKDHELKALYLRSKPTLDEAGQMRRKHFTLELMKMKKKQRQIPHETVDNVISPKSLIQKDQIELQRKQKQADQQSGRNDDISNVSAMQLAHKDSDLVQLRCALQQLLRDSRQGNERSIRLLNEVDPQVLQIVGLSQGEKDKNKRNFRRSHLVVESIEPDFVDVKQSNNNEEY